MMRQQEDNAEGRREGRGRIGNGVTSLWIATGNSDVLQVTWTPACCDVNLLASSHCQPPEVVEDMGPPVQDLGKGEGGPHNFRPFLPDNFLSSLIISRGDVGVNPPNRTPPREISSQGGNKA